MILSIVWPNNDVIQSYGWDQLNVMSRYCSYYFLIYIADWKWIAFNTIIYNEFDTKIHNQIMAFD